MLFFPTSTRLFELACSPTQDFGCLGSCKKHGPGYLNGKDNICFPLKSSNIQKRNIKDLLSSQCLFGDLCIIFVCYFTRCSVTKCIPSIPPKASLLSPILKQSSNTFNFATKIPETTNRIGLTIGSSENETHRFETAAHSQYSRSSLRFSEGAS